MTLQLTKRLYLKVTADRAARAGPKPWNCPIAVTLTDRGYRVVVGTSGAVVSFPKKSGFASYQLDGVGRAMVTIHDRLRRLPSGMLPMRVIMTRVS